jgi:outer membrane protein TolC
MKAVLVCAFAFLILASGASADTQKPLSFQDAVEQIIGRSTDVETQRAQVSEQIATDIPFRTAFLPNLTGQLARYRNQDNALVTHTQGDSVNLIGKLNLFRFGADFKGWQAAKEDEDTQRLKLASTILNTESLAVQALVSEIQSLKEGEVLSSILKKEQELFKIGRERYERGLLPQQEVEKIEVDMENAAARLADTQTKEASARAALVALLGNDHVEMDWPWIAALRALDSDSAKMKAVFGNDKELADRPDVRAAAKNLEAQEDHTSQKIRAALPSFDSSFTYSSYGFITQPLGSVLDPQWTAQLTITVPLFDQLAGYSAARIQYFEEQKANVALDQTQRAALADWSSAKASFSIALTTAIARDKTAQISRKLYNDSLARFKIGRINANDLSLDESRLSDSELLATAGWAQAHLAYTELCHSRGLMLKDCF